MADRTAKMTQSRGDVVVWGRLARSRPRWLDRGVAWTGGHGSTWVVRRSTWGAHGDRTVARGDGSVECAPLAQSVTDWLVRVMYSI
jgi:hypothetical protein